MWGDPKVYEATNVRGTENVIAACREHDVNRLVFTSSPSVISSPTGEDHAGVDESLPYPNSYLAHYPRTKAAAERIVLATNGESLRTTALRPHLIIGAGDPQASGEDRMDLEALREIAGRSGGSYFFAADQDALTQVYARIDALAPRDVETLSWRPRRSLAWIPMAAATAPSWT